MQERKCFGCGGFRHITHYYRNIKSKQEEEPTQKSLNKFEAIKDRVMNIEKESGKIIGKNRKTILKEEKLKKKKSVEVQKIEVEDNGNRVEKKEKLLREVILNQEKEEEIVVEALLNNSITELVMSSEFARKNKFKKKRLERLIYVRNIDGIFNYEGPIEYMVEVELFFKEHKERILIDVIRSQKQNVILGMLQLTYYNLEINQRTEKVQMTKCLEECGKKWQMRKTKLEWQKQKEKKEEFRKLAVDKEMKITRIIKKK